jgi:hypothetical protein
MPEKVTSVSTIEQEQGAPEKEENASNPFFVVRYQTKIPIRAVIYRSGE